MKRLARIAMMALPLMTLAAAPAYADVKTRDKSTVKFEGMLGRMFNLFGGKGAREGIEGLTAVKGSRKATINDTTGHIVDLSEEKVYDLDLKRKTYTVTTFDELRRRMREAEERGKKTAEKEEPGTKQEAQKPTKEYEVDFDVRDTGQKKQIATYDAHETVVTITVREKGKTLEESGGIVMTNDMWLGPKIPQLKELADSLKGIFDNPIKGFGVISDYARRRASLATTYVKRDKQAFTKLHPALVKEQALFEEMTGQLATSVDRILRKHGKNIIGKQFASRRLADMMIDLFVLSCTMARVSTAVSEKGAAAVTKELEILQVLTGQVKGRVRQNLSQIDDNDDEYVKSLADHALDAEAYIWDNVS